MVNVSKNKLKPKINKHITEQFVETVAALNAGSARIFFQNFFTGSERLLFSKRLAIIYLLREGVSPGEISRLLKVSRVTVYALENRYAPTEREAIVNACLMSGSDGGLLGELKDFLFEGLSLDGKKRIQWLNEFEKRYQK
jgi:hypothetical protein